MKRILVVLFLTLLSCPAWAEPTVTLVDAGKGKKAQLRYAVKKAQTDTLTADTKVKMTVQWRKVDLPRYRVVVVTKVGEVKKDGSFDLGYEVTDVTIPDDPANAKDAVEALRKTLPSLIGARGKAVVTARGILELSSFTLPEGADPSVKDVMNALTRSVEDLSTPFPEEAVGVGARWTVTRQIVVSEMKVESVTEYELTAMDGGKVSLTTKTRQSAPAQKVGQSGEEVEVTGMTATGTGSAELDLRRAMPLKAAATVTMKVDMVYGGQAVDMTANTDFSMTAK